MQIINIGTVQKIKDGIISANGLSEAGYNEVVKITNKYGKTFSGLVLGLDEEQVNIVVIGDSGAIAEGDRVEVTGDVFKINVSEAYLGRIIDPLGNPLDGKPEIRVKSDKIKTREMPLMKIAPGVIERQDVSRPLQTGIKAIDSMIPIGRGQRQLIIGDRQTGKTAITIDTIINQNNAAKVQGLPLVKCIYVAIGQKVSKVAHIIEKLKSCGALEYTVVVLSGAADSASLQYLAPFTGTAIGEYFAENGSDALVIYDDLTKHAWAYRELSLLLERPAGREAYPGDIFYLHSALLERSVQFTEKLGGGSLTALPIIETQAGDVSAYIPTNVISITDGQIYLESDLFNAGVRPAINVGLSVSRVGGSAQSKPMKQIAGQLRLDLAQYRALAAFAQFGSDLDQATKQKLKRGEHMVELLKQDIYEPLSVDLVIMLVYAGVNGYLDNLPLEDIKEFELSFMQHCQEKEQELLTSLASGSKIEGELETKIKRVTEVFAKQWRRSN